MDQIQTLSMATAVVPVHRAKAELSRLLVRVTAGETIVIARSGRPIAKLVAVDAPAAPRKPGTDEVVFHGDFDTLPPTMQRAFGMSPRRRKTRRDRT